MQVTKRIKRYLKGIYDHDLFHSSSNNCTIIGYPDSDRGGDLDDRKSDSGYCFNFFIICSWSLENQLIVILSTCEAEYIAAVSSAC